MEWVETTGRTIAEALDAALDELGVDEDDVEYEVLEEPKSGFLGRLGSSEGRIRARVKPISREKPGERQRRNAAAARRPAARRERQRGRQRRTGGSGGRAAPADARAQRRAVGRRLVEPSSPRWPSGGGDGGERRSESRPAAGSGAGGGRNDQQQGSNVDTIENDVPIEEQAAAAERFTQGLVDTFDLGAQAKSVIDDDVVVVEVTGDNLGLLVGPEGRDAARDRGAGAHRRAAPDRRSRRPHPRRRRRLPGQASGGAGRVHPLAWPRRCSRPARPRRSSRCRPATARSSTTPRPRSTGSPRCPRARTRADASSCAPPDPARPTGSMVEPGTVAMTDRDRADVLAVVLEEARELGLLGPGSGRAPAPSTPSISPGRSAPFDGRFLDLGSGGGLPGLVLPSTVGPSATGCLLDAQQRRCEFLERAVARARPRPPGDGRVRPGRGAGPRSGAPRHGFDLVVARSFGAPAVTAECAVGLPAFGREAGRDRAARRRVLGAALARGRSCRLGLRPGGARAPRCRRPRCGSRLVETADDRWPRRDGIPAKRPLW